MILLLLLKKHNRGFHGHSRAKSRIEFSNLYRQSAKPRPPEQFCMRQRDDALKHVFSKHDNKQIFLNDPMLFGSGNYGKKKIDSVNKSRWKPDFVAWNESTHVNREHASRLLKRSVYQRDFCCQSPSLLSNGSTSTFHTSKLLTARSQQQQQQKQSPLLASVYACNFNHNEPTSETSKETQRETYFRFIAKNNNTNTTTRYFFCFLSFYFEEIKIVSNVFSNLRFKIQKWRHR